MLGSHPSEDCRGAGHSEFMKNQPSVGGESTAIRDVAGKAFGRLKPGPQPQTVYVANTTFSISYPIYVTVTASDYMTIVARRQASLASISKSNFSSLNIRNRLSRRPMLGVLGFEI